jgi:3-hydroxybutyrate dehydrogenase
MSSLKKFGIDKIWVVTGAASGIGLEMTRSIAKAGAVVWALDFNLERLNVLEVEAKKEGWDVFAKQLDVTDRTEVQKTINQIKAANKRIDVWINNAGIQRIGAFSSSQIDDFNLVMQVNLFSVIDICQQLIPMMEDQGNGVILNMASVAGHVPAPFMASYVTSKHAVVGFSKALQAEFEMTKSPLRMAFASPGFVDTAIIAKGKQKGFPEWLNWMLTDAKKCAQEILTSLAKGQNEIHPTLTGTLMRAAYGVMPKSTVKSSKVLLTKGFKDLLLNRFQVPR